MAQSSTLPASSPPESILVWDIGLLVPNNYLREIFTIFKGKNLLDILNSDINGVKNGRKFSNRNSVHKVAVLVNQYTRAVLVCVDWYSIWIIV